MARIPIAQLFVNATLRRQPFLLREKSLGTTRSGSNLLHVVLGDRTGSIPGVMFNASPYLFDSLTPGEGVEVSGQVEEFHGMLQIKIDRIVPTKLENISEYLPTAQRPIEEMQQELDALLATIHQPDLRRLLDKFFGDKEFYHAFSHAPAAKLYHHACIGGLLEHTLAVTRVVLATCSLYPDMNRDLALVIALLHDIGKIHAYNPQSFDLTEEGILHGHLFIGTAMVDRAIESLEGFDRELRLRLIHGLLAHHGRQEYGSPVVPMTIEAIVVHQADMLDANARGAIDHLTRTEANGEVFTEWSNMHDARLYRGTDSF